MESRYDVVVAGAGPAGLQFARDIATRSERSVVVLERNDALADNDKSTGGTFSQLVERFDVPTEVVMAETDGIQWEGPTTAARTDVDGYVLDFPALLESLGAEVERAGGTIRLGTRVTSPVFEDGHVVGVEYHDGAEPGQLRADVVVDATGPTAELTRQLGMFDRRDALRMVGKEYEVEGRCDLSSMLFSFDHTDAPGGYAWTFPAGDGVFKAGVCWFDEYYQHHADSPNRSIDAYVDAWVETDPRWERESVRAVHAGSALVNDSMNTRAVDGAVAVGDAVSSINPLLGEGIRPGMESATMAADVVLDALSAGDTSRSRLATYERRWNRARGRHWKRHRLFSDLLYDFSPSQQDQLVRNLGALSTAQVERFHRYEPTIRDFLDLYHFEPDDVQKLPSLLWKR